MSRTELGTSRQERLQGGDNELGRDLDELDVEHPTPVSAIAALVARSRRLSSMSG